MRIKSIKLKNIRSFNQEQQMDFYLDESGAEQPISIIVGPNGGGKSNLIDALQAFMQGTLMGGTFLIQPITSDFNRTTRSVSTYRYRFTHENNNFGMALSQHAANPAGTPSEISLYILFDENDKQSFDEFVIHGEAVYAYVQENFSDLEDSGRIKSEILLAMRSLIEFSTKRISFPIDPVWANGRNVTDFLNGSHGEEIQFVFIWLKFNESILRVIDCWNIDNPGQQIIFRSLFTYLGPKRQVVNDTYFEVQLGESFLMQKHSRLGVGGQEVEQGSWGTLSTRIAYDIFYPNSTSNRPKELFRLFDVDIETKILSRHIPSTKVLVGFKKRNHLGVGFSSGEAQLLSIVATFAARDIFHGVVVIDEPELHLHPSLQKSLFEFLSKLAAETGAQLILVSHSPYMINEYTIKNCMTVRFENGQSTVKATSKQYFQQGHVGNLLKLIEPLDLGDILFSDQAILFEGIADRVIYKDLIKRFRPDLDLTKIALASADGKGLLLGIKELLEALGIPVKIIADQDFVTTFDRSLSNIWHKNKSDTSLHFNSLSRISHSDAVAMLSNSIRMARAQGIFILPSGELEHYIPPQSGKKHTAVSVSTLSAFGNLSAMTIDTEVLDILYQL